MDQSKHSPTHKLRSILEAGLDRDFVYHFRYSRHYVVPPEDPTGSRDGFRECQPISSVFLHLIQHRKSINPARLQGYDRRP